MSCPTLRRFIVLIFPVILIAFSASKTNAQEKADKSTYQSETDDLLSIEKVSVLPFTDNLQGIYARPLEAHFSQAVDKMHRWDFVPATNSGMILSPEELEAAPAKALQVAQGLGADAFFAARVTKGPNGVIIHLSLFLSKDGKLLSQAILKDYKQFNLNDLKEQMDRLLSEIVSRIPYSGRVLSREANRVTVNLGSRDGIQKNQMLSVIQLIKANRHPKFNFLVRTEKEIFGKIKVLKVDETLSFGVVVTEKERGAIQKGGKIGPLDFVTYSGSESLSIEPSAEDALQNRDDANIAFGKDARAWQPQRPATFGQIGARIGLAQVKQATQVSGVGGLEATNPASPSVTLDGELWITPEWTFSARIRQGLLTVNNPREGSSTPKELNQTFTDYEASIGYRLRFGPYGSSPYAEPQIGFLNHTFTTEDTKLSTFMSQKFTGFKLGVSGMAPLTPQADYGVGGEFTLVFNGHVKEKPKSSGSDSDTQIVKFGLIGFKKLGERLKAQVHLDFEMYSASFSGAGTREDVSGSFTGTATSSSQRFTTLSAGLYYMF